MNGTEIGACGIAVVLLLLMISWRWKRKILPYQVTDTARSLQRLQIKTDDIVEQYASPESVILADFPSYPKPCVRSRTPARIFTYKFALVHQLVHSPTTISDLGNQTNYLIDILQTRTTATVCPPCSQLQLVHRLCPHNNVVQSYEVEQKDSLDEHLDVLTRKLADKEGRLRLSKSKVRETQNEIDNLHAIDNDVKRKYREIMNSLRQDLLNNEKDCKKLQEQIEWVSRRRAELKDEVRKGQRLYGEAAAELASNLAELQRGRGMEHRVTEKPQRHQASIMSMRHRKEPQLPSATPVASLIIKSSEPTADEILARVNTRS